MRIFSAGRLKPFVAMNELNSNCGQEERNNGGRAAAINASEDGDIGNGRVDVARAERHGFDVAQRGDAGQHQHGFQTGPKPARMSVRRLSPTITVSSECACILFNAARMIHGLGLPT